MKCRTCGVSSYGRNSKHCWEKKQCARCHYFQTIQKIMVSNRPWSEFNSRGKSRSG